MSALAERYMQLNPQARISITGGGTRSGISAMINNSAEIIAASRDLTRDELAATAEQGLYPEKHVIARDAIAIVVNPRNPVQALSLEQVRKIFTGQYSTWNHVSRSSAPVLVYSRESSSGTFRYLQETVLNNQDFSPRARFSPSNSSIIESVSAEPSAIGYVGLAHARESANVKVLSIISSHGAIAPSNASVESGSYPISRQLLLYSKANPSDAVAAFTNFCLSAEGQSIVLEYGYVPVVEVTASETKGAIQ